MIRYAFGRFYVALIGVLLLTVPLFALMRIQPNFCPYNAICDPAAFPHRAWWYPMWTGGQVPGDYWPIALLLLGAGVVLQLVMTSRSPNR